MSRDTPNQHPRSHLYTMRVWQEEVGHDRTEWRGKVHLITNGNVCYFRGWEGFGLGFRHSGLVHSSILPRKLTKLYLSMILGANFESESGPEIPLNVSL